MLNKIKEMLKRSSLAVMLYEGSAKKVSQIKETDLAMRYTSIGEGNRNKDKKFFQITSMLTGSACGLYSTVVVIVLPYIDFAIKKGWVPVIDLRPVKMPLLQDDKFGIENPWEYYYKQPISDISLDEVHQSSRVIDAWYWRKKVKLPDWTDMCPTDGKTLKYWNKLITSYIRLNDDIQKRIGIESSKIFRSGQKVLGVGIRAGLRYGAVKNEGHYNGHSKVPTCEELIDIVESKMRTWKCDHIFVSCDDREYLDKFRARWGEKCYFFNRRLFHFFKDDMPVQGEKVYDEMKDITIRERNEEYIIETYLLAQCHCCYSCHGDGATFAYFLNGGQYEHAEFYNAGKYEGLGK